MRYLSIARVRRIRAHLRCGGIIAYATESCFGLGCDPENERALRALLRIKRRPKSKGLIVVADRMARFSSLLRPLHHDDMTRIQATWPGPQTWLIPANDRALHSLRGDHTAIAARVTAHIDARNLCARLQAALVSTSANRAGQRPVRTTRECLRRFGRNIMVIPGRIGTRKNPSTIQDLRTGKIFR
jgi:L-threonylcarbamoyladenylate synthase